MKPLLLATAVALLCAGLVLQLAGQQPATIGPLAQIHPTPDNHIFPNGQAFVYDAEWRELGWWGPRPAPLQLPPGPARGPGGP